MRKIILLYEEVQPEVLQLLPHLIARLHEEGYITSTINVTKGEHKQANPPLQNVEMFLVLGGDGTILHAAHLCAEHSIPILGVNFGRVGYLTELEPSELARELPAYLNGAPSLWIDERAMLQAVVRQGDDQQQFLALNDMMIARGTWPRGVYIKAWIDDLFFDTFYGDGIILSTPTGSTAYNISVGGPILHPKIEGYILTPIAPHLASNRALVIPLGSKIQLQITTHTQNGIFSADGQWDYEVKNNALVTIDKSPFRTRFIRRKPPTHFYEVIHGKQKMDEI
ncbi:NAD(+)/NADH kinase [Dictyobacter arantiisoli]|uniref:NAD kinase n=1 Tax=Dictyobacter arantiisoli TaxID=2014874 RepID=A0A5A5TJ63_9CHLR|nr:NAD(+)/NADH kinase [Dictyobacter arantiisoli]GCF11039.1 hypothetical protein KDI_46030 [Dictyobacter arantiisoli]